MLSFLIASVWSSSVYALIIPSQAKPRRDKRSLRINVIVGHFPATTIATALDLSSSASSDKEENQEFYPRILLETDRILVLDKPHGIPHHTNNRTEGEIFNESDGKELGILALLRKFQEAGELSYSGRLYGVHRLDRVTSGILLLAKDAEMAQQLTKAFRDGRVVKYYTGISNQKPLKKKQGWVKGGMERGRRKSWYLTRGNGDQNAKNYAVTRFFSTGLGSFQQWLNTSYSGDEAPRTLLLFRPYTGKSHQLRVAAKSVGLPLRGDPIYRDGKATSGRTYLHATAIHVSFSGHEGHDAEGDTNGQESNISVFCPPPFQQLWSDYGTEKFRESVATIFEKHCDCDEISRLVSEYYRGGASQTTQSS